MNHMIPNFKYYIPSTLLMGGVHCALSLQHIWSNVNQVQAMLKLFHNNLITLSIGQSHSNYYESSKDKYPKKKIAFSNFVISHINILYFSSSELL